MTVEFIQNGAILNQSIQLLGKVQNLPMNYKVLLNNAKIAQLVERLFVLRKSWVRFLLLAQPFISEG